jgi:hypothetical protein
VLSVAGAFVSSQACGPGSLDDLTRGRPDSGALADVAQDAGDASVCVHASAPERPNVEDGPNIENLVFAFDDIRFDTGTEPRSLPTPAGLDLDKTCTCPEAPSCTPRSDAAAEACDFDGGRDNVTVTTRSDGGPTLVARQQIQKGFFTAVFQVQGWNGKPDDPHVIVGLVISSGSQDDADGERILPKFDGNDVWKVDPVSLAGGDNIVGSDCRTTPCVALSIDPNAYVVNNTVVSRIDSAPIRIRTESGPLVIDFIGSTVIAKISGTRGAYRLEGELSGRWPTDRLLSGLAGVRDPISDKSLCPPGNKVTYDLVKRAVCESADLAVDPSRDRTSAPCNALSAAISFSAVPALLGKIEGVVQEPSDCIGFTDSCDNK